MISACSGESATVPKKENVAPIASAGDDQTVDALSIVSLDAVDSKDPDGAIATYQWQQLSGPDVALNNATSVKANFMALDVTGTTTFSFEITVTDDQGLTASDTKSVTVTVENIAPIASAGSNQVVDELSVVYLDAIDSKDMDGTIATYQWQQISGPDVALNDATTIKANFTAPDVTSTTTFSFEVTVTDDQDLTATDTISVTVNHIPKVFTIYSNSTKIHNISGMTSGNFTQDELADLVIASTGKLGGSLSLMSSKGNGEFHPKVIIDDHTELFRLIEAVDLDQDQHLDILAATDNDLFWYKGLGNGNFEPKILINKQWEVTENSVHFPNKQLLIDDINGDSKLDLIWLSNWDKETGGLCPRYFEECANALFVSIQTSATEFNKPVILETGESTQNHPDDPWALGSDFKGINKIYTADINGDSIKDVIAIYGKHSSWITNGWSIGEDSTAVHAHTDISTNYEILVPDQHGRPFRDSSFMLDVDQDGDQDLIYSIIEQQYWRENTGTDTLSDGVPLITANKIYDGVLKDVDQDGIKDIITSSKKYWQKGKADGFSEMKLISGTSYTDHIIFNTFDNSASLQFISASSESAEDVLTISEPDELFDYHYRTLVSRQLTIDSFTFADYDADGDIDIAVKDSFLKQNFLITQNSDKQFSAPVAINEDKQLLPSLDLDNDGTLDEIWLDGHYLQSSNETLKFQGYFYNPIFVDIDNDDDIDVIKSDGTEIYYNNNGNFTLHTITYSSQYLFRIFDMDNNGLLDIVYRYGGLSFQDVDHQFTTKWNHHLDDFQAIVDLNNDGHYEILFSDYNSDSSQFDWGYSTYSGDEAIDNTLNLNTEIKSNPVDIMRYNTGLLLSYDLDNDNALDLIFEKFCPSSGISWYKNNQDFTFTENKAVGESCVILDTAHLIDFNSDNKLDVVLDTYCDNKGMQWFKNRGTNQFSSTFELTGDCSKFSQREFVDLDGDGKLDVLGVDMSKGHLFWVKQEND
jgi:hypothetical protein